ncbi:MAG: dihydropteroate synthase [Planctomycetales bacterium 71-10]|nr:MAG: dihydropteroate synthase [Planctomycetales bacterium 71-10]
MSEARPDRVLFVTGRLAEFALRQVLDDLAPRAGIEAEVAVLPITVAALMTPAWIAKKLRPPEGVGRIVLPGHCRGDLGPVEALVPGVPVAVGPEDLRDLPRWFGQAGPPEDYGEYDVEILAEINHAPRLSREELVRQARAFAAQGADVIDVGCEPGEPWAGVGDAVRALRDEGLRVSIDSFDPGEVARAVAAGAELVLSVNAGNRDAAKDWGAEVVVLPDRPGTLDGLDATVDALAAAGVPLRIDPILEPIGFGFAESLGRYLEVRRRYPDAAMMMGIGNLTELTDVDSAGVNVLLMGFCQEQKIRSVLTTAVINWARSSVRELDLARRLVRHAVVNRVLPKRVEPGLVMLRDPRLPRSGPDDLAELQRRIRDPNWRIFAEDGLIYALNNEHFLSGTDPFLMFESMGVADASHAFYLGWEMMKARTALTLGKAYRQDQALSWGFLTEPEASHRLKRKRAGGAAPPEARPTPEEDEFA